MSLFDVRVDSLARSHVSHEHSFHPLVLCTGGETDLSVESLNQRVNAEYGCIIPCAYHHEYEGDGRNRTLVLDMPLTTPQQTPFADEACWLFDRPRFFRVDSDLRTLTAALMAQLDRFHAMQDEVGAMLVRALCSRLPDRRVSSLPVQKRLRYHPRVDLRLVNALIDAHLDRSLTVAHLAEACSLSVSHLHSVFRARLHMTPYRYIQQRRMDHARRLIESTNRPLGVIAGQVGFTDQASFSRACRRYLGATPSRLRNASH